MTLEIQDLADLLEGPWTGDEGRDLVRELIATAPQPIPLETLDTPGTHESAIVYALGEAEAMRSSNRLLYAASGFRSTASRPWLGVVADQQYGMTAGLADRATTNLTVANASGAVYGPFLVGELRFRNSTTDAIYENAEACTILFGANPVLPTSGPRRSTLGIRAVEAGAASSAQIGEIEELETPLEGVTVTNAQPALGRDEESAENINVRIDARIGAFGVDGATGFATGATKTAFESIAKNGVDNGGGVPREDGSRITVTRTQFVRDDDTGDMTLYVADDDGPIAGGDLTLVESAVQAYAEWVGVEITLENTVAVPILVEGTVTITGAAATNAQIEAQWDVELTRASRESPVGGFVIPPALTGTIPLRYVENAVESAGDAGKPTAFTLVDIELDAPAGATALDVGEVAVLTRGEIAIVRLS